MQYEIHTYINCIDAFKYPSDIDNWFCCPDCGLKPKVWIFDNGRMTACGCWNSKYDHKSIRAESIVSILNRNNGSAFEYDRDALRENWNCYCKTREILFQPEKEQGRRW